MPSGQTNNVQGLFPFQSLGHDMPPIRPSLIETLRSDTSGAIPLLAQHLQRLDRSAHALEYPCPLAQIEQALVDAARHRQGIAQRLRLLLHHTGHFELHTQPLPARAQNPPLLGLAALTLHVPNPWLAHKTTHRPEYARAQAWLHSHPQYFDCLFINQHGQLCEGSRSTVYLYLDGRWQTPPLACGVLPGIMRRILLESGQVCEQLLTVHNLEAARAWRLSNAVHGWIDVRFDRQPAHII